MSKIRMTRSDRELLPLVVYSHLLGGIILLLEGAFGEARTAKDVVGLLLVAPITFLRYGIIGVVARLLLAGFLTGLSCRFTGWPPQPPRRDPGVRFQDVREPLAMSEWNWMRTCRLEPRLRYLWRDNASTEA